MMGEAPNFHDFECPECAVRLGSIRMAAIVDNPERHQAFMDTMRDIVSDTLKEIVRVRPAWPIHLTPRRNTNALPIPRTDACAPHPPPRSARQAKT